MKEAIAPLEIEAVNHPRTLFKPASWLSKIDFINHLILFNNLLITVLSEQDGGKTSFFALLNNNLDSQINAISITAKAPCNYKEIIDEIIVQMNLNKDVVDSLSTIASIINDQKSHRVLIIDDAHNLPSSFISQTQEIIKNQGDLSFFHVCLISENSIIDTLLQICEGYSSSGIHTIELGPLNESEARTYVLQRAMNGRLINKPLTDDQFKQFYQSTKGNLAHINQALESFIQKCTSQKNSKPLVSKRTGMALTIATLAMSSYLYYAQYDKLSYGQRELKSSINEKVAAAYELTHTTNWVSHIPSWRDSSTVQMVHYTLPKRDRIDTIDEEEVSLATRAVIDKVVVIPAINSGKASQTAILFERPASHEIKQLAIKKNQINSPIHQASQQQKSGMQELNQFTIQLVASHKKEDVVRFRKEHRLTQSTSIRYFTNAQGSWYILTLGEFKEHHQALQTVKKLPHNLVQLNPWVRQLSGLSKVG